MTDKVITIGTRGSDLALWQANYLKNQLKENCGLEAKLQIIQTTGDKITDLSFDKIEGKGFFTKELEENTIDASKIKCLNLGIWGYPKAACARGKIIVCATEEVLS